MSKTVKSKSPKHPVIWRTEPDGWWHILCFAYLIVIAWNILENINIIWENSASLGGNMFRKLTEIIMKITFMINVIFPYMLIQV